MLSLFFQMSDHDSDNEEMLEEPLAKIAVDHHAYHIWNFFDVKFGEKIDENAFVKGIKNCISDETLAIAAERDVGENLFISSFVN